MRSGSPSSNRLPHSSRTSSARHLPLRIGETPSRTSPPSRRATPDVDGPIERDAKRGGGEWDGSNPSGQHARSVGGLRPVVGEVPTSCRAMADADRQRRDARDMPPAVSEQQGRLLPRDCPRNCITTSSRVSVGVVDGQPGKVLEQASCGQHNHRLRAASMIEVHLCE